MKSQLLLAVFLLLVKLIAFHAHARIFPTELYNKKPLAHHGKASEDFVAGTIFRRPAGSPPPPPSSSPSKRQSGRSTNTNPNCDEDDDVGARTLEDHAPEELTTTDTIFRRPVRSPPPSPSSSPSKRQSARGTNTNPNCNDDEDVVAAKTLEDGDRVSEDLITTDTIFRRPARSPPPPPPSSPSKRQSGRSTDTNPNCSDDDVEVEASEHHDKASKDLIMTGAIFRPPGRSPPAPALPSPRRNHSAKDPNSDNEIVEITKKCIRVGIRSPPPENLIHGGDDEATAAEGLRGRDDYKSPPPPPRGATPSGQLIPVTLCMPGISCGGGSVKIMTTFDIS